MGIHRLHPTLNLAIDTWDIPQFSVHCWCTVLTLSDTKDTPCQLSSDQVWICMALIRHIALSSDYVSNKPQCCVKYTLQLKFNISI